MISPKSFDKKLNMVLLCSQFIESTDMVIQVPTFIEEETLIVQGYRLIAGVDEVGRGPLAGPVVAAAIILPLDERPSWLSRVRDSKQLTPSQRESIFDQVLKSGVAFGVGSVSHEVIDERGIAPATRLAMRRAIEHLSTRPDYLLIDFMRLPGIRIPQKSVVDGDSLCLSIAAASIVAKVTRDRHMVELDSQFPGYGLAQHKGYGTPEHLEALQRLGPCAIHRKTFTPVRYRLL
jgi:ribonuclease HII